MNSILQLLYNMGALISISIISGFINYKRHNDWYKWLTQGILFGFTCIIGMLNPLVLAPGLIFDGRSVMLSVCGMFFGPISVLVAASMTIVFRIYQGGSGTIMGVCVIIASSLIGTFYYIKQKEHDKTVTAKKLYSMGIIVHIIMILLMFTLPKENIMSTIKLLGIPIIMVYPFVTILIGKVLSTANERRENLDQLKKNKKELLKINEDLEASIEEVMAQEEEIREQLTLIQQNGKRLSTIFDQAPIGIVLSEMNTGIITYANSKFVDIIGFSLEEIIGRTWMSITYPEDIKDEFTLKQKSKVGICDYNKRYIKKDETVIWANIKIVSNLTSDGSYDEICFIEDVTKKKQLDDALVVSEFNFRMLFENSADAILTFQNNKIVDCNKASTLMFTSGKKEKLIGMGILDISPEKQPDGQLSKIKANRMMEISRENSYHRFEWTHKLDNGVQIVADITLTPIVLNNEEVLHTIIRDVTERKRLEMEMEYISYHDKLTGVYNRRFFQEELRRLDVERNLPLTLMMGDVNGLKLINDSFGHAIGDKLLKKVADIIQINCRKDEIVSRIGGDEFVIIIPKANNIEVEAISNRILKLASEENLNNLDISISFGWESKVSMNEDIGVILKKAEDRLYKKKLFESPSLRSKNITTIMHTLHEKNEREEKHSKRVSELCEKMGIALQLSENDIKELKSVGLLHDIGKIGINESMLNKSGALSHEEWIEMSKHSEIGYRILSTVNEMSEMAEYVLAHHERWDGKGYPKGLKAEEIPFKARIIALADSYDAMTSDRSYRMAMSSEEAIEEILKNSGIQFDPFLAEIFVKMIESC